MKKTVLVTGGNGQLGQCIQSIANQFPSLHFLFVDKDILDITNEKDVLDFFEAHHIHWCINCAAYTAVDHAEENQELALQVNVVGARNIANACQRNGSKLIQISTDFVFDGKSSNPYKETDRVNPLGVYGLTKLNGEVEVKKNCPSYFIVRTSWLYSEFGNNFMKTMLRLGSEKTQLSVVNDQIGSPTYAIDLAEALIQIIQLDTDNYGIYHYSNHGQISWFDFAKTIFELTNNDLSLNPILSKDYATLAERPKYSVLDTSKITDEFALKIPFWKDSLANALSKVK
ncbi:dTDP-4-dehydrorhamnose reductase [Gelidibacter gilvus]|uniref:dTDP-4-dehydrorhamnose reductase n=1 Tax=Gelidibacter gilvus TaxID=59602 RepID=A0A4Q0XJS4_9FLAO|nr:dTDP-4-dehydrorhamnose reductase [Gelidibacter gilvus]RXJ52442.1 dTDP-4-dehydrorhamnose reductase [Gelidibacter gilvus]